MMSKKSAHPKFSIHSGSQRAPLNLNVNFVTVMKYILREKSLAIYFEDSQFRRNRTFNFILSNIYVDKRSRIR